MGEGINSGDTAWMLTSTAFVLFMTLPGLAMFYGGLVRVTSVLSVFMQCFAICCVASILWMGAGYSLAFTDGGSANGMIGGMSEAFLKGITPEKMFGTIPESVFFMFQMTFAIITPALIVGAYPERVKFDMCLLFSALWLMAVYVPVTHWVWGGGWAAQLGVMDFAGGIVVHTTAGVSGLVFAYYLGPRYGFPHKVQPPHNPVLTAAGAAMLWVGWFGFNAGSAVAAGTSAGMAMAVTHMAAASAALSWSVSEWAKYGKPTSVGIVTGMVAGLAAVTPASGYIGPLGGVLLGTASGIICEFMTKVVKDKMAIDDSLDVFAVHGIGGMLGSLTAPFLADSVFQGLGLEQDTWYHVGVQFIVVSAVAVWSAIGTLIILWSLDKKFSVRVSEDDEIKGLDAVTHGEQGYGGFNEVSATLSSAALRA